MNKETIQITKYSIVIGLIVLFGIFLRLYALDRMALHHDESIHAYYSHMVYKGNLEGYKYNPVYHGPFLYHYGALFFLLFGDNDFAARLPFVSFGILLLYFVWRLKPWIGKAGVLACLLLAATSPTLTYFARFARNDVYMGTMALGIIVFGLEYLRLRRTGDLVWMAFFLALMYTCKENSYMTGFFLGSFAVFYGIYYFFSYSKEGRKRAVYEIFDQRGPFLKILTIYAVYSCFAFTLVRYVVKRLDVPANFDQSSQDTMSFLHRSWDSYLNTHQWIVPVWIITALIIIFGLFILYAWIRRWATSSSQEGSLFQRIASRNVAVIYCMLVVLFVYSLLFTTLGTNLGGMRAGVVDYLIYWMFQQDNPRIAGPPDYFIPRILVYEITAVVFALIAFVVYLWRGLGTVNFFAFLVAFWGTVSVYSKFLLHEQINLNQAVLIWLFYICIAGVIFIAKKLIKMFSFVPFDLDSSSDKPREEKAFYPDGFRIFLLYWSVLSLLVYALLQEKVPWLLVHQVLPLVLLAGTFIGDLWERLPTGALRKLFVVIVALFVVYEARTDLILNFYNADNPRETMVYTQTAHINKSIVEEIKRGAEILGAEYMPPNPTRVIAALHGVTSWPYSWYLRNYLTSPHGFPPEGVPYALMDPNKDPNIEDRMKVWAKGRYTKRRVKLQVWWPPPGQDEFPFQHFKASGKKQSEAWEALFQYILYRKVWDGAQPGSKDFLFYTKTPLIEPLEKVEQMKGYDQNPQPLNVLESVGSFGQNNQQFNEPRGIALSPDRSIIYVLDAKNARIQAFNSDFKYVGSCGSPGNGMGEFKVPKEWGGGPSGGIDVGPDGTVYVTDTWADGGGRIVRFQADGTPLPSIRMPQGQSFFYPRGLTVAPDGVLFVSDTGNNRIVWFNPDGSFGGILGQDELKEPVGITDGPNGLIYVCDVAHKRIASFNRNGNFVKQWMILGWNPGDPRGIPWIEPYVAVDRQGNVYVTDSTSHTIHRFDQLGQQVVLGGGKGTGNGYLNRPKGIAVDVQGNLYIADSNNHRVLKARLR